jgi:hypothetical protein
MNRDEILEIYRECGVRFASRWDGTGTKAEERLIAAASRIESLVREEIGRYYNSEFSRLVELSKSFKGDPHEDELLAVARKMFEMHEKLSSGKGLEG